MKRLNCPKCSTRVQIPEDAHRARCPECGFSGRVKGSENSSSKSAPPDGSGYGKQRHKLSKNKTPGRQSEADTASKRGAQTETGPPQEPLFSEMASRLGGGAGLLVSVSAFLLSVALIVSIIAGWIDLAEVSSASPVDPPGEIYGVFIGFILLGLVIQYLSFASGRLGLRATRLKGGRAEALGRSVRAFSLILLFWGGLGIYGEATLGSGDAAPITGGILLVVAGLIGFIVARGRKPHLSQLAMWGGLLALSFVVTTAFVSHEAFPSADGSAFDLAEIQGMADSPQTMDVGAGIQSVAPGVLTFFEFAGHILGWPQLAGYLILLALGGGVLIGPRDWRNSEVVRTGVGVSVLAIGVGSLITTIGWLTGVASSDIKPWEFFGALETTGDVVWGFGFASLTAVGLAGLVVAIVGGILLKRPVTKLLRNIETSTTQAPSQQHAALGNRTIGRNSGPQTTDLRSCGACGASVESAAEFCSSCGHRLRETRYCHSCGHELEPESAFCHQCGEGIR